MIRVGFELYFDDGWLGGINYFRNLFTALYDFPERQIEVVIFTGNNTSDRYFEGFPPIKIVRSPIFDRGTLSWMIRKIWQRGFLFDLLLERLLKEHGVDVLSHSGWLAKSSMIPTIGWMPDFQHIHLPEFFNKKDIATINKRYHNLCRKCSMVILSSFDAQSDLIRFEQNSKDKSEVLQFVASIKSEDRQISLAELEERYKFSGNYFLLPNQFWKHKNHLVVIEALGLLKREGKQILVLATGNTKDSRHPHYFDSLMNRARDLAILDNFRPLGLVPGDDLTALMRHATAIINPSFFEGWSTSVEEAKSMGKRILLSDISVHQEQNPPSASYFFPSDSNKLASLLWNTWNTPEDDRLIAHASSQIEVRRHNFAKTYQAIVLKTISSK